MQAGLFFHGMLNDLLPPLKREHEVVVQFQPGQTVKHLMESCGVPHTEVSALGVNGHSAELAYRVVDGDHVQVYPYPPGTRPGRAGDEIRFILDNHLGRLAAYLRLLGFDTLYRNDYDDVELAETAEEEERIVVTRDIRLLMRKQVKAGYWVRSKVPRQQIVELVQRYALAVDMQPFKRCLRCNTLLQPVAKEAVFLRLQPLTRRYYHRFHICPGCQRVYWRGSHYERMLQLVQELAQSPQHPLYTEVGISPLE